jgi:hypothetical protein
MNDETAVFVRRFRVGAHTVIMTMSRRKFRRACMTCRWTPTKPTRLTKEEKRQYRSGRLLAAHRADSRGKGAHPGSR